MRKTLHRLAAFAVVAMLALAVVAASSAAGTVTEIEKYGHAVTDIRIDDFLSGGFALGDTVDIVFDNGYEMKDVPFFNGYYVGNGEPVLRAYPGDEFIAVCINYGKLNEIAGVAPGNTVTITLNTKEGRLADQELNSLVYTDSRDDYASDEIFANFRMIDEGNIAEGVLYRSASPVNNENGRAAYGDALIESVGVNAVLNLADTDEEIDEFIAEEGFASDYYLSLYEKGNVIALGMPVDYSSSSFAETLASGLAELSYLEPPYLVHCTEGKDRAGFTSALLESLMGASEDEVVADYMESYSNYYGVDAASDPDKYELIVENNIMPMLSVIKGNSPDAATGAAVYLLTHGMTLSELTALIVNLSL